MLHCNIGSISRSVKVIVQCSILLETDCMADYPAPEATAPWPCTKHAERDGRG